MRNQLFLTSAILVSAASASATTVFSNTAIPGDLFINAGGSNQGQAVGTTGWHYNNVRNSGSVGIRTNYARSGNGSAFFEGTIGPAGSSSKSDIELLVNAVQTGGNYFSAGSLGRLGDLTALGYDWYRSSASTNDPIQHAALRLLIDVDGDLSTFDRGGLVFERAYNGGVVTQDTWVSDDVFNYNGAGSGAIVWAFGGSMGNTFTYGTNLQQWMAGSGNVTANSLVVGVSAGIGSGWGPHQGAVDNIFVGFNGNTQSYNFEVVPEPATMSALALGIAAMLRRRRSR